MKGFVQDIEDLAVKNEAFRRRITSTKVNGSFKYHGITELFLVIKKSMPLSRRIALNKSHLCACSIRLKLQMTCRSAQQRLRMAGICLKRLAAPIAIRHNS